MPRTYRQQLAGLLRQKTHRGWSGQVTKRGYPSSDRAEVVAELFGPDGQVVTYHLVNPYGKLAVGQ